MHHICIKGIDVKKALSYDSAFFSGTTNYSPFNSRAVLIRPLNSG